MVALIILMSFQRFRGFVVVLENIGFKNLDEILSEIQFDDNPLIMD